MEEMDVKKYFKNPRPNTAGNRADENLGGEFVPDHVQKTLRTFSPRPLRLTVASAAKRRSSSGQVDPRLLSLFDRPVTKRIVLIIITITVTVKQ